MDFKQLKRNCTKDMSSLPAYKLAVLGDCATQHIATALKGYAYEQGYAFDIFDADYNQIDAQLIDAGSELFSFSPSGVLFCMCTEKLYERFAETPAAQREDFAQREFDVIEGYWSAVSGRICANIIQFNFAEYDDGVFGSYANKTAQSFLFQLRKLNLLLAQGCQRAKNVFIADVCGIQNRCGREGFHKDKLYYIAKMPFTNDALPLVAKAVVDVVKATLGNIRKCVICDLDNTLWGGVVGDDGLEGIELGELGTGHAFCALQTWLRELKNRGIILAVCSKNNEDTAKEPFEKHPDMVLRLEDISVFVANWQDKATNIKSIREILNIGMDSIVFLDDNPFERNLVRSLIPDITVPELPEDPAEYLDYLQGLNLFETANFSAEDKDRTAQYKAEAARVSQRRQFADFGEYLQSLEMTAEAKPFDSFNYPRISQLSLRSNQFNLRTVRWSEADIERLARDDGYITLYFTLKDRFGDHGLISAAVMKKQPDDTLFVENWFMSCRVLKRTMEEFIVNRMLLAAKENGCKAVVGEYLPTPKNSMVADIYERMGFKKTENGRFVANVGDFKYNNTYIKETE